jgi:hypothetical protein
VIIEMSAHLHLDSKCVPTFSLGLLVAEAFSLRRARTLGLGSGRLGYLRLSPRLAPGQAQARELRDMDIRELRWEIGYSAAESRNEPAPR